MSISILGPGPPRKRKFIGIPDPKNDMVSGTQTTIFKWLFQLDDEPNLYIGNGWNHQTSILNWLFGVPGNVIILVT